jgi:Xaa-Pro aminopeptidase
MYPHQAERLDAALARLGVDALVATSVANVAYITGFWSLSRQAYPSTEVYAVYARTGTGLVVPAIDAPALVAGDAGADRVRCHGRFHVDVGERGDAGARRAADLVGGAAGSAAEALAAVLDALDPRSGAVGLDDGPLTESGARAVRGRLAGRTVISATEALAGARAVKGPYEIDCLQQALRIAEESIHDVLAELEAGTTEREAVACYERALVRREARPSATIIAFGPDAALPAAFPGERPLRAGDLVRFDVGCVFKGYHADVARTAVLGEPTPRQQALYDAVDAGLDAALAAIRPGARAGEVFDAAIAGVRAAGLAEYRRHHVGHGIGLEPAETPWIAADGPALEAGMVLRVETPYYELGTAGVHVKDTVLVNSGGAAVMNRSNRGLVVID